MKKSHLLYLLMVLLMVPSTAQANVGTPLIWGTALHLVFGNAFIGMLEGALLGWIFQRSIPRSMLILIVANYLSAWAGYALITSPLVANVDMTIENIGFWLLFFTAAAFFLTLLIEFPFFWFALRNKERPLLRAIRATPLIHGISYALLFGWYWLISASSMMTNLNVVSADQIEVRGKYELYYLTPAGNQIIKTDLQNRDKTVLRDMDAPHIHDRLFVLNNDEGTYHLYLYTDLKNKAEEEAELITEDFALRAGIDARKKDWLDRGSAFNYGPVPSLVDDSDWKFSSSHWPSPGIIGTNETLRQHFAYGLELPIQQWWRVRNAVHLEEDLVLFQLGRNQICLLRPTTKQIALVARGKGPVVAIPKTAGQQNENLPSKDLPAADLPSENLPAASNEP